ncbi:thioesterase domain-containing protein [Paenibacillus sp. UMB4589-SE434]|uniref:thioesterase II family protein n=1 Tax=Paenibacillus sp. UMB4589-SE434 TaxID=3046314 RepID=UPI00254CB9A8|nr:thioesterase domain-containing protein [Paenibacillus sp. UMB4589-SE434]MDK8183092.1 alpha/beta fold hydrolase [Paenibacillus sp. UMB4589-SE434]
MQSATKMNSWLLNYPKAGDQIRLFCLPYAGGGASVYRGWQEAFPAEVGVYPLQLPGRENRISEQPICSMQELVYALAEVVIPHLDRPFMLFGHSLGARIAFELARHLRRVGERQPSRLIVSGSRAPHIPEPKPVHHLPDDAFIRELRRLAGTPETILQSRELINLFLPMLRADFTVDETYSCVEDKPLSCPITAFGGTKDTEAAQEEIEAWQFHTTGNVSLEMIDGDHFFVQTRRDILLPAVSTVLRQYVSQLVDLPQQ